MNTDRCGIILNTQNYEACVAFYGETLGLPQAPDITPDDPEITCFDLGGAYLMIETGGCAQSGTKPIEHCPTKFRFNVEDVESTATSLRESGVDVEVLHYSWGTIAEFCDPDGNRCALRSVRGFGS
jgi:lactoylglutathione lyase